MDSNLSQIIQLLEGQRRERPESEHDLDILNMWAHALAPATQETEDVVRQIDELCPSIDENERVLEFLWSFWDIMLSIARNRDVTSQIQERLVKIVLELKKLDKGMVIVDGQVCAYPFSTAPFESMKFTIPFIETAELVERPARSLAVVGGAQNRSVSSIAKA